VRRNVQAGKGIKVKFSSWHAKDKQTYQYESEVSGNGGPIKYSYIIPNLKQDHVQQHARSRAQEASRHELRVTATVAGDPSCNASMALQLNGTGQWDQTYDIDTVHHALGNRGHVTSITARSAKEGRSAS
jgi:thiol:disulfide interchange protein